VLLGDMSLVGPRPPVPAEVVLYRTSERRRLSMRPGITCIWQVNGRSEVGFADWVKLDVEYIENWSFALDFQILLKTIPAVLGRPGPSWAVLGRAESEAIFEDAGADSRGLVFFGVHGSGPLGFSSHRASSAAACLRLVLGVAWSSCGRVLRSFLNAH